MIGDGNEPLVWQFMTVCLLAKKVLSCSQAHLLLRLPTQRQHMEVVGHESQGAPSK